MYPSFYPFKTPAMEKIKAVIVEDELLSIENLRLKIKNNCPAVYLAGEYQTCNAALEGIQREKPQLVFLDIGLDTLSGFDLLKRLKHMHFEVIFTTTSREHHIEAIRAEAVDYLSKPFTDDELVDAVNRAALRIRKNNPPQYLHVPGVGKDLIIPIAEIMYCKAANNFTEIHVAGEKRYALSSDNLKKVEERLPESLFYRIHKSHCVNRDFIKAIIRETGLKVQLKNGSDLEIARDRKDGFYGWMGI